MELTIKCQLQLYICIDTTITVFPNKTTLLLHVSSFSLKNKKKQQKILGRGHLVQQYRTLGLPNI